MHLTLLIEPMEKFDSGGRGFTASQSKFKEENHRPPV